jgi:hypothetical protein
MNETIDVTTSKMPNKVFRTKERKITGRMTVLTLLEQIQYTLKRIIYIFLKYNAAWPFRGDPSSGHAVEITATYSASKPS